MWFINILPSWVFQGLLLISIFVYFSTYLLRFIPIPALYIYKTGIQFGAIGLLALSVFILGATANDNAWLIRVKDLEYKVQQAEQQSQKINTEIVEKIIYKTQVVRERGKEITKFIDREVVKYDNTCQVPAVFIEAHNRSAEAPK